MNKKLQVFVSSTYTDLIEERQAAVQAILDAGHIPAGMELFKAGKSQMKTICKWIDESDVYMLILGGRYGSIEEESKLSYTELEYQYALSKNMPVFAIILNDNFLFTKAASNDKDTIFEKDNIDKYNNFKKNIKSNIVKFASNIDQIFSAVHSQLNYFINDSEYNLLGWTRNPSKNPQSLNVHQPNEWKSLQIENQSLKTTNESLKERIAYLETEIQYLKKDNHLLKTTNESLKNTNKSLKDEYVSFKKAEKSSLLKIMEYINKRISILNEPKFDTNNITHKKETVSLTEETYNNIKLQLQKRNFLITLNPNSDMQRTAIQDCFTIFLNNYYLLENGVLSSDFKWQTGLLYAHVCPFLKTYNLVKEIKHDSLGLIYIISTMGAAFYQMATTIETNS